MNTIVSTIQTLNRLTALLFNLANPFAKGNKRHLLQIPWARVIAIAVLLTCLGTSSSFGQGTAGLAYTLINGNTQYSVTGYTGSATTVEIPDTYNGKPVTRIGEYAFKDKTIITNVTISASVSLVDNFAFSNCSGLNSVTFADGSLLGYFSGWAFYGCVSLQNISIPENNTVYKSIDGVVFRKDMTSLVKYPCGKNLTNYIIPSTVKKIEFGAFYQCDKLIYVDIPTSLNEIEMNAFSFCQNLTSINIPSGLINLSNNTFQYCDKLATVTFGENSQLISIGEFAFYNCLSLSSISVPSKVISIGKYAFSNCNKLADISFAVGSLLKNIGENAFASCFELQRIDIPYGVTGIGRWAFSGCIKITSINIPSSVTVIEDYTFQSCIQLTGINIPSSINKIGAWAFKDCKKLNNVIIPDGVTRIEDETFNWCEALTNIRIPSSVTSIGSYAFSNCDLLTKINIPSNVNNIGGWAFSHCDNLTDINLPSSLNTISNGVFDHCINLKTIDLPINITSIGLNAFWYCSNLTQIIIPSQVVSIGTQAFEYCTALKKVISEPFTPPTLGTSVFANTSSNLTICVPDPSVNAYKTAANWSVYASKIISISRVTVNSQPLNSAICISGSTTFTFGVAGSGITYQWQVYNVNTKLWDNLANGGVYSGVTSATLSLSNVTAIMDGLRYKCLVTSPCAFTESKEATLEVFTSPPTISISGNVTACAGASATFTANAAKYKSLQWQVKPTGGSFTNINGETSSTLTVSQVSVSNEGYQYQCVATNPCGSTTSLPATLSITDIPVIVTQPIGVSECAGATVSFTVAATNVIDYQWQKSSNGTNYTSIVGATNPTYTIPLISESDAVWYSCKANNSCGYKESNAVKLTLKSSVLPTITVSPKSISVKEGLAATFTVNATNVISYQWQQRTANGDVDIPNANSTTLTIAPTSYGMNGNIYLCKISGECNYVLTDIVTLTVRPLPRIISSTGNTQICQHSSATFTVVAEHAKSYQWQWGYAHEIDYTNIPESEGGKLSSYTTPPQEFANDFLQPYDINAYRRYKCIVTNEDGSIETPPALLTIIEVPRIGGDPVDQSVCLGKPVEFEGMPVPIDRSVCHWEVSTDGGNSFTPIEGNSSQHLYFPVTAIEMKDNQYRIYGVNKGCIGARSKAATLSFKPLPKVIKDIEGTSVCAGSTVTFSIEATDVKYYIWEISTDDGNSFNELGGGATSPTKTISTNSQMIKPQYRCKLVNECGSYIYSKVAILHVYSSINVTSEPQTITACEGESKTFSISCENVTDYQWQHRGFGGFRNIPGATTANYTLGAYSIKAGYYRCRLKNTVCGEERFSNVVELKVIQSFENKNLCEVPNGVTSVCDAQQTSTYTIPSVTNAASYSWRLVPVQTGANPGTIEGSGTTATITWNPDFIGQCKIDVRAESTCGKLSAYSTPLTVTVGRIPGAPSSITGETSVCLGSPTTLSIQPIVGANSYAWELPTGTVTTAVPSITFAVTSEFNGFEVKVHGVSATCGNGPQSSTIITVKPLPDATFTGFTKSKYCLNDALVTLVPNVSGGTFSGNGVVNGNQFSPQVAGRGNSHQITYRLSIDGCWNSTTQTVGVEAPFVNITNLNASYCASQTPFTLEGTPSTGGIFRFTVNGKTFGDRVNPLFDPNSPDWHLGANTVTFEFIDKFTNCSNSITKVVVINPIPTVTITSSVAIPILECANIPITLTANPAGGTAPYNYNWNQGESRNKSIGFNTARSSKTYSVLVEDRNGCSSMASIPVSIKPTPEILFPREDPDHPLRPATCKGADDGELKFFIHYNGQGSINYSIKPHNTLKNHTYPQTTVPGVEIHYTDLSAGLQIIEAVSPENGCTDLAGATILDGTPRFESVCVESVVCSYNALDETDIKVKFTLSRGAVGLKAPFNYQIVGENFTQSGSGSLGDVCETTIHVNPSSYYEIRVLDITGYQGECYINPYRFKPGYATIKVAFDEPTATYRLCDASSSATVKGRAVFSNACMEFNPTDLQFRLHMKGNSAFAPVLISSTDGTFEFTGLNVAGDYLIDVIYKGKEDCTYPASFKILPIPDLDIEIITEEPGCNGEENGKAIANITGNDQPVTYKWFKGNTVGPDNAVISTQAFADGLGVGFYTLAVYAAKECPNPIVRTFELKQPDPLETLDIEWLEHPCKPKANVKGGVPPYTITWHKKFDMGWMFPTGFNINSMYPGLLDMYVVAYSEVTYETFSQPEEGTIKPGWYKIEVVDAKGCRTMMDEPVDVNHTFEPRVLEISYRWRTTDKIIKSEDDPKNQNTFDINVDNTKKDVKDKALECAAQQVKQYEGLLKENCNNVDKIDDKVIMEYNVEQEYNTLYFTDRTGKFIRTVAPKEVQVLDGTTEPTQKYNETNSTQYYYNNMGQLVAQTSPDGGRTDFIYNSKGLLRFSQNNKQFDENKFSYTKYDELNRVVEVGECSYGAGNTIVYDGKPIASFSDLNAIVLKDDLGFNPPSGSSAEEHFPSLSQQYKNLSSRTVTVYSTPELSVGYKGGQRYLRNRVSYSYTVTKPAESFNGSTRLSLREQRATSYYSYDPHGNVEWIVQEQPYLGRTYIEYEYDLISNKVRKVKMNPGRKDAFFHRYEYDEDNRLLAAYTSPNGEVWDRDARYSYYSHGPLKRIELGQDRIQGIDYTYTLNGWLKAINAPDLKEVVPGEDLGFAKDMYGMVLGYHQNDFSRRNAGQRFTGSDPLALNPSLKGGTPRNLYNGNISTWVTALRKDDVVNTTGEQYSYDKLNRIKGSDYNTFSTTFTPSDKYSTSYTYDLNGNIKFLDRNGDKDAALAKMDDLEYFYYDNTNRLKRIKDDVVKGTYTEDIDDQTNAEHPDTENYEYDKIGNLIRDKQEGISITWNVYGKIAEIIPDRNATSQKYYITYTYDAAGNRISKQVNKAPSFDASDNLLKETISNPTEVTTTYYMRDASGNTMAVYERNNRAANGHFEAVFNLIEVPLYGSDRLGMYKPNPNNELAIIPFNSAADFNNVTLSLESIIKQLPGTQTMVASTQSNVIVPNFYVKRALYNSRANSYAFDVISILDNTGSITGSVAVGENTEGQPKFYVVPSIDPFPGKGNMLNVYNASGGLMANSYDIKFDPKQQHQVAKALGSDGDRYFIFTIGTDGVLYYHVVDMTLDGGKGDIVTKNKPLAPGYKSVLLAAEDYNQNRVSLLVSRSVAAGQYTLVKFTLGALDAGNTLSASPDYLVVLDNLTSYGVNSLQLSPDGKRMLVYNLTSEPNPFVYSSELRIYEVLDNLTLRATPLYTTALSKTAGGCKATFTADGSKVVVETKEESISKLYTYTPAAGTLTELQTNGAGSPQLFTDGRVYVSQHGTSTMQVYSSDLGTSFGIAMGGGLAGGISPRVPRLNLNNGAEAATLYTRTVGLKKYELKDHLGNVTAVVSDIKTATTENGQTVYKTGLEATYGYYPFGMLKPGLNTNANTYRYGYNGKEMDNDVNGTGVTYDYGFRIYDARIAKFLSVDPLTKGYPSWSPYPFAMNRVIDGIDLDGLEYVSVNHYANGTTGLTMFYKMTDKGIKQLGGTKAGIHNSVSFGPEGKGVVHNYYNDKGEVTDTYWEQRQSGGKSDFQWHGLYSGPGCVTYDGKGNYNFNMQPIDWADAIAKQHDKDYDALARDNYAGFLEDIRTVQADRDMVTRIDNFLKKNWYKIPGTKLEGPDGVETPVRTTSSTELEGTLAGQRVIINALAIYKQWKIDNKLGNDAKYKDNREAFKKAHSATADILDLTQ